MADGVRRSSATKLGTLLSTLKNWEQSTGLSNNDSSDTPTPEDESCSTQQQQQQAKRNTSAVVAAQVVESAVARVDELVEQGVFVADAWHTIIAEERQRADVSTRHVLAMYQRATAALPLSKCKRTTVYIQLWLEYARLLRLLKSDDECKHTFQFMKSSGIGKAFQNFFLVRAQFEAQRGNSRKASELQQQAASLPAMSEEEQQWENNFQAYLTSAEDRSQRPARRSFETPAKASTTMDTQHDKLVTPAAPPAFASEQQNMTPFPSRPAGTTRPRPRAKKASSILSMAIAEYEMETGRSAKAASLITSPHLSTSSASQPTSPLAPPMQLRHHTAQSAHASFCSSDVRGGSNTASPALEPLPEVDIEVEDDALQDNHSGDGRHSHSDNQLNISTSAERGAALQGNPRKGLQPHQQHLSAAQTASATLSPLPAARRTPQHPRLAALQGRSPYARGVSPNNRRALISVFSDAEHEQQQQQQQQWQESKEMEEDEDVSDQAMDTRGTSSFYPGARTRTTTGNTTTGNTNTNTNTDFLSTSVSRFSHTSSTASGGSTHNDIKHRFSVVDHIGCFLFVVFVVVIVCKQRIR
ncbi:hypothetical protein PTSG_01121 [Salpingoeca rosetta]|uniref:BUB1 N-terminal domain-containing protein n=1 Tax=Salpingoeca rosetta (strain ATCC 50818 / BSB-021) TaxID=946362 RepID=F2U0V6_SALR5|nr:uncharacterized protein PTSG_01121 [Salpingoeca rosetta]EGD80530.1 hypothetical protein PTSG_01121 [Salpingoeca rosetta]|eukprot:XP_004997091.1 hypothetical protein PTSG_01121 [Salpingoeca rosetta]